MLQVFQEDSSSIEKYSSAGGTLTIEILTRYIDVTSFLLGVSFPLFGSALVPKYPNVFDGIGNSSPYIHRVPMWQLIEDTWAILGPLMTNIPEMCSKLALLCGPLAIDTDQYHSRRIMSNFPLLSTTGNSAIVGSIGAVDPLKDFKDDLQSIRKSIIRIDVWRWLFERERTRGNIYVAEYILQEALRDTADFTAATSLDNGNNLTGLRGELTLELVRLQCRNSLYKLDSASSLHGISEKFSRTLIKSLSLTHRHNTERAQNLLLKYLTEIGWVMFRGTVEFDVLCIWDLLLSHKTPALASFLYQVSSVIKEISSYCIVLDTYIDQVTPSKISPSVHQTVSNALETIRHQLISKFLADGIAAFKSVESQSDLQNVTPEQEQLGSRVNAKRTIGGMWMGVLGVGESLVAPTEASQRRRSDLFSAFAITLLVQSCSDLSDRFLIFVTFKTLLTLLLFDCNLDKPISTNCAVFRETTTNLTNLAAKLHRGQSIERSLRFDLFLC